MTTFSQKVDTFLRASRLRFEQMEKEANELCAMRRVRIISDFNGQPFGHSRPSLKGREFVVSRVILSGGGGPPHITLWLRHKDRTLACSLTDVEWLE